MFFRKRLQSKRKLIAYEKPQSVLAEQYRNIRTNIQFASIDQKIRSLVVTSANPGEGKTTTTANLAVAFAQQGDKILLIDADLRKPVLHQLFHVDAVFGLTDVLSKQRTLQGCIAKTDVENVHLLPCGPIPPNPAELLGSTMMGELLQEAKEYYDLILFDTPPVLAVTDAQVIANQCEGTVLVLCSGKTEKEQALKAKNVLHHTNTTLLGVVLNAKPRSEHTYGYY
ncbi:CpsD/CapB family tyrosine-protein kinase [Bacillus cereus group sp. BfR-BA-01380]|uniref:CpsD/CapB family tyrosine-protein kinase n=1 Tax=Bacillus cereus group sp. BfR-BA-01380 TaxID=2920324 RepID=UPI001F571A29